MANGLRNRFLLLKYFPIITLFLLATSVEMQAWSQDLVINEAMSSNLCVLQDEFGEYSDWIEIYNPTSNSQNMNGYFLSDDEDEPDKWSFPNISIQPNGYLLIFASGRDTTGTLNLHANFKLNSDGESILLSDPNLNLLDQVTLIALDGDRSFGRISDGSNQFDIFYNTSPNGSNSYNSAFNNLSVSHEAGFYNSTIELQILSSKPEQTIHYTFDGSLPSIDSPEYNEALVLTSREEDSYNISGIPTTPFSGPWPLPTIIWKEPSQNIKLINTLRFRSFSGSIPSSDIFNKTYVVDEDINSLFNYPFISLITESENFFNYDTGIYIPGKRFDEYGWNYFPDGNYINNGSEWERNIHLEFFETNGEVKLSQNCGVRIHGGWSAAYAQKSLRLAARDAYGKDRFGHTIFPQLDHNEFKDFILRNSGNDFIYTHFRDALMQNILSNLDLELGAFRPSIVFLNGEYWGIHNIRERYNEDYFKRYFNIQEENLIVVGVCGTSEIGDNQDYLDLDSFIRNNDLTIQSNFDYVASKVDIENFTDYHIAQVFYGNFDWPDNNNRAWKTLDSGSKWRWLTFDLDGGFGYKHNYDYNNLFKVLDTTNSSFADCSTLFLQSLLTNNEYEEYFINRFAFHLNVTFQSDSVINRILSFKDLFEPEMDKHFERWHYPDGFQQWENEIQILIDFAKYRPCYCTEHVANEFDLTDFNFICDTLSIDSSIHANNIQVFPNPCSGILYVKNNSIDPIQTNIRIINRIGQLVAEYQLDLLRYEIDPLNLEYLSGGLYIVTINYANTSYNTKIIIE